LSTPFERLAAVRPERRIYLDLDDVLAETTRQIVPLLNARFEREVCFDELRDFDLGIAFELTDTEREHAMDAVHDELFLRELPLREGVLEVLREWDQSGYHLAVITGRPPDTHGVSLEWLADQGVPHHTFVCVDKYGRHGEFENRVPLDQLRALSFEIALEDSPEMALFLTRHSHGHIFLMDRPWNREHDLLRRVDTPRMIRIHEWSEITAHLRSMTRSR